MPLPHGYPFLLLDRGPDGGASKGEIEVLVSANAALLRGASGLPPFLALEVMAQAALMALPASGGAASAARGGMLAGVESVTLQRPLRAGDRALVRAVVVGRLGPVVKVRAELRCDDETIAEGELLLVLEGAAA